MGASGRMARGGLVGLATVPLCACTAIGWLIGHDADKKARPRPVPPLQVATLDKGKSVELVLRDGSVVAGRFDGMEPVPYAQYQDRWKQGLQLLAPATLVPGLGEVRLHKKAGGEANVTLVGLRPGQLAFREAGHVTNGTAPLDSVAELGVPGGGSLDGATLSRIALEGRLPFLDAVAVKTKDGARQLVPVENVRSASVKSGNGALKGLLAGLVIDAVIVGVAVHEMNNMWDGGSTTTCNRSVDPYCTSCPTVYSEGADGLRLDAEPLGGSLLAADEAIDRARLGRIEARGGAYRVVVRNEMRETEYLDSVRLLVVDHAAGAEVVPAMDGSLYLVHDAAPPVSAVDDTGANLAPLLASADARPWVESPLARDADDPASRRATAVLAFRRPPGARSAVLDLSVQATDWGLALFGHVLGLQGDALDPLLGTPRERPARAACVPSRVGPGGSSAPRGRTRRGWRAVATLAHIPLLVAGRRVVPIDMQDVEGDTLRVRIDALARPLGLRSDRRRLRRAARHGVPSPRAPLGARRPRRRRARDADGFGRRAPHASRDERPGGPRFRSARALARRRALGADRAGGLLPAAAARLGRAADRALRTPRPRARCAHPLRARGRGRLDPAAR